MSQGRWSRFCVIGVGSHARTKLIPAMRANGQSLVGVVSRRVDADEGAPRFATVAEAVAALPPDTAFFVASPPTAHFEHAMPALEAGRDVIVEKPAFVRTTEAEAATRAAEASGALLIEGFMNRHTVTHRLFLEEWAGRRPAAVDCTFTLPAVPEGTFRADAAIGASNLYDVACYVLAALIDVGLDLDGVELDRVDNAGQPARERLHLSGNASGTRFSAVTGVADHYENVMRVTHVDGSEVTFTPFVFGRPGPRLMTHGATQATIQDVNAFEAMLARPLQAWRADSGHRHRRMIDLTRQLERLGGRLAELRAAAP